METVEEEACIKKSDEYGSVGRQVIAAMIAGLLQIFVGYNMSYSSILVPQLIDESNTTSIDTSSTKISWILSANALGMPLSGLVSGWVIDRLGRVTTMKISSIPGTIGWLMMAIANSAEVIVIGRFISGFATTFIVNSVYVYVGEVSKPSIRGTLLTSLSLSFSVGLFLMYVQGRYLHWRWVSWAAVVSTVVATVFLFFIPESPLWLVSKNRIKQAKKALSWFFKVDDNDNAVDNKIKELVKENESKMQIQKKVSLRTFAQPTVYKPFLILAGLFTLQRFSGVYVIIANAVVFFRKMGVTYDPYLVTIFLGVIRIVMSIILSWLSKMFNRRTLLIVSGLGTAASLGSSALATGWLQHDKSLTWLPVVLIIMCFVFSGCGLFAIPNVLLAELFPLNVRGVMQSLTGTTCHIMSFASLYTFNGSLEFLTALEAFNIFTLFRL
ncbi:hypothetical protein FQR65_LT00180 [Abscondita terminalis]|nr:hypothetical protein FQR65_LT00180 [Abscondita terminalis]